MYQVLLCHRRKPGCKRGEFHARWQQHRSELVEELKSQLRFSQYAQVHQLPWWNLLYQSIRLSRGRLAQELLLRGRRQPVASKDFQRGDNKWDVVEEFWYPAPELLAEVLTSHEGAAAANRLVQDQASWVRNTVVIVGERFIVSEDAAQRWPRLAIKFCLRRAADMSRDAMLDYWASSHKHLFMSLQPILRFHQYDQVHVRTAEALATVASNLGGRAEEAYDGVACVFYHSQWDLVRSFLNPRSLVANTRLLRDEANFIDSRRSTMIFGKEYKFGP